MSGRATTQTISATELTEGESDAVRIRHQLDAWANASNRTPRLVATPAEDIIAWSKLKRSWRNSRSGKGRLQRP